MSALRLVIASANPDKVAEIEAILAAAVGEDLELVPRPSDLGEIEETGETLVDNARLKAEAVCAATGMAAIADDTGLSVSALGGAPGVYSARYAGEGASYADNVAKLLGALEGVPDRSARFETVALAAFPDGSELVAEGAVEGSIAGEARGNAGFGYDPVFIPLGGSRTYAEMNREEKSAISHRGRAFRALAALLAQRLATG